MAQLVSPESHRLGLAIDQLIQSIAHIARNASGKYFQLATVLPQGLATEISEWAHEQGDISDDGTTSEQGNLTKIIAGLENELLRLHEAMNWSVGSSGFTWWLQRRQHEMGLSQFLVIPRASYSSNFEIDTRSRLTREFDNLEENGIIDPTTFDYKPLADIRLLSVPRFDGLRAIWYPILTHELAHLKYDSRWITDWLTQHSPEGETAKLAVEHAKNTKDNPRHSRWFDQLIKWLIEVACDAAMWFYYRNEGANALESITAVIGKHEHSATHPAPAIRLLIQRNSTPECIRAIRVEDQSDMDAKTFRNAFCELAFEVKAEVMADLEAAFPSLLWQAHNNVRRDALQSIQPEASTNAVSPSTQSWPRELIIRYPAAIESGLVRALWSDKAKTTGAYPAYDKRADLIARSLELIEFVHRFEQARDRLPTEMKSEHLDDVIPNNLWVSASGVSMVSPESASEEVTKFPAYDLRLGRYFVAFNRNQITTLDATNHDQRIDLLQREVEVAWNGTFVLHPGEMVLGVTLECLIMANDCTAQVLSRSSIGRLGLLSATAVHIQPGYQGCPTLELVNLSSVPLYLIPGQRIAQVVPYPVCGQAEGYVGHYQNVQWRPQFSVAHKDWDSPILQAMKEGDE
ncbi:MAG TPA: dCTP deaminase [Mycobacterium sp.]|nr:dCTP deaminase [Mycobacterium sp.]HTX94333.1 dCTP deaminase [Mycobacterium sp.]